MKKAITLGEVGDNLKEVGEMLSHVVKHMATKEDLTELESRLTEKMEAGRSRLSIQMQALDSRFGAHENQELDKRMQLDVRVDKVEKKVFARK